VCETITKVHVKAAVIVIMEVLATILCGGSKFVFPVATIASVLCKTPLKK
jgi:hypothetical protein